MEIKELFDKAENGTLTYEQFVEASKEAKFVDLNTGDYVSNNKYTDEVNGLNEQIKTLNATIKTRDKDLKDLQSKLADTTTTEQLETLSKDLSDLQAKYDTDTKNYQAQLKQQAYEFGVSEFANTFKFTSEAAKRDFKREMNDAKLKMDDKGIIGANDFYERYKADNPDSFVVEKEPESEPSKPIPQLTTSTQDDVKSNNKHSLSELMAAKNANPNTTITFN